MSQLNVGIVGCGRMGRERARSVAALGSKVSLLFDTDVARSRSISVEYQGTAANSLGEFLTSDLDAVFVCVPPGSRGEFELECLNRRLPVLSEKPAGLSRSAVSRLAECTTRNRIVNAVGYMNRYRSSIQNVRRKLQNVTPIGFSAYWVCRPYAVPWWTVPELSGGPHNEQATHLFDLTRFFFGQVCEVQTRAIGQTRVSSVLTFKSGVVGSVFYSCDGNAKDIGIRIFTDKGTIALSGWDFSISENTIDAHLESGAREDIFLQETQTFLAAVCQERQDLILSDFFDAQFTQAVMDAASESINTGKTVEINEHARNASEVR